MKNLDLAREFLRENPDLTVGDAVYIKSFARWLDARPARSDTLSIHTCETRPYCDACDADARSEVRGK